MSSWSVGLFTANLIGPQKPMKPHRKGCRMCVTTMPHGDELYLHNQSSQT